MERPEPERFGDLQQPERRRGVAGDVRGEGVGEPPLEQADRDLGGLACRDDLRVSAPASALPMPSVTQASATPISILTSSAARAKRRPRLTSAKRLCAPAPSHKVAMTLRISGRATGSGGAAFGRRTRTAASRSARRASESQGRMRTSLSTMALDTGRPRGGCARADKAAALVVGSAAQAKPSFGRRPA
jgi:hypothetical protein